MDSPGPAEPDDTGVSAALEKIVALESRLRQAIQNSHPLSNSFDRDVAAADREREALLAVGCNVSLLGTDGNNSCTPELHAKRSLFQLRRVTLSDETLWCGPRGVWVGWLV